MITCQLCHRYLLKRRSTRITQKTPELEKVNTYRPTTLTCIFVRKQMHMLVAQ